MLARQPISLPIKESFEGAGIYAIYYFGDFSPYASIAKMNKVDDSSAPIYIGKAVPAGARKGGLGLDIAPGTVLYKRLSEHAKSIELAVNLNLEDFYCRYLVVDDIWIPLGESLLIETFSPLWNMVVDGFGIHNPGSGRHKQRKSLWDVIHPGRNWAEILEKNAKSVEDIITEIKEFLA